MHRHLTMVLVSNERGRLSKHSGMLERHDVFTIIATDVSDGISLGQRHHADGGIVSLDEPAANAQFCRQWSRNTETPAMVLATRYDALDAATARHAGAADYVTFATGLDEFVARVRPMAYVHHLTEINTRVIRIGGIEIDEGACDVRCGGRTIRPTATEFRIMQGFASSAGRVLNRRRIADFAGHDQPTGAVERTIEAHIKNIRRKLGVHAGFLQTVRGFGYRFAEIRTKNAGYEQNPIGL